MNRNTVEFFGIFVRIDTFHFFAEQIAGKEVACMVQYFSAAVYALFLDCFSNPGLGEEVTAEAEMIIQHIPNGIRRVFHIIFSLCFPVLFYDILNRGFLPLQIRVRRVSHDRFLDGMQDGNRVFLFLCGENHGCCSPFRFVFGHKAEGSLPVYSFRQRFAPAAGGISLFPERSCLAFGSACVADSGFFCGVPMDGCFVK